MRLLAAALTIPLLALGAVACSDDEPSACAEAQDLQSAVSSLLDLDLVATGTDGLSEAVDDVQTAWKDFKSAAGDQFGSQVDGLEDAISTAEDDLSSLGDSASIGDAIDTIGADVEAIQEAWGSLAKAVNAEFSDCDLSTDT